MKQANNIRAFRWGCAARITGLNEENPPPPY